LTLIKEWVAPFSGGVAQPGWTFVAFLRRICSNAVQRIL